ncbi:NAD-dependent deacetylase sirtuin-2 [Lentinus tigrinus ALCF2SS1-7]|uniref:NAD-dependent deacetylase sirtuin-2 n=1 Tax=Lentinus tigrinus ALCF2SS1-6 TaxID=1328759 RepID=A0A5C2SGI7_9APHY|nr:NAD-dependent deacetylase sirtuin-2 [Lentinus tigrinus ALCF2SS1-6]RPD77907.1 NAD-dependent deacetylase sirtuin-2 [Lentinus tigrinus ALCF2SS1-7]
MGNEFSTPYEGPTELLEGRDIPSIAKYMKSDLCKKVFVMLGAGVSTAAGIPDFRSPETGLYSNLQRLNLPYPEAVFEISYFRENPLPFYTLARELYPGRFRPTLTHTFVKVLADHSYLDTCFTQNIDTLERQAHVPGEKIVEAHGSFADQHCIDCHARYDGAKMKAAVENGDIVRCEECDGLVKPDIVFFGESLPPLFQRMIPRLREADLLFVIGTSLKVHPFASLTSLVPESCPRVLINMESAGDIGSRPDDVVLLGRCDEVIRELARELGWEEELDREWGKTEILVPLEALRKGEARVEEKVSAEREEAVAAKHAEPEAAGVEAAVEEEEKRVEAEVEELTEMIEKALELSETLSGEPSDTKAEETKSPETSAPGPTLATGAPVASPPGKLDERASPDPEPPKEQQLKEKEKL